MKKLFKFGLFAAMVAGLAKVAASKKAEWQGLTETQVRDKLQGKLADKMPDDKVNQISDKVVEKMRQRGVLGEEAPAAG